MESRLPLNAFSGAEKTEGLRDLCFLLMLSDLGIKRMRFLLLLLGDVSVMVRRTRRRHAMRNWCFCVVSVSVAVFKKTLLSVTKGAADTEGFLIKETPR